MRRLLAILVLALVSGSAVALTDASDAQARTNKWYWTEGKAERRVERYFGDVRSATCIGFGYNWRYDSKGREVFTAFYCYGPLTDGGEYQITIYTTSNYRFKWFPY
jgi:hypothetical protein